MTLWAVPREWEGETAAIIGGGPSLAQFDVSSLKGKCRVVGVNDAFKIAPWIDVLYFADGESRWYGWNKGELHRFKGKYIVTRAAVFDSSIKRLLRDKVNPLSRLPYMIGGFCGGANAINLAYLFGAKRIILLGFDMRPGNWHSNHKKPHKPAQHVLKFIPALNAMAPELANDGVEVINATPGSALKCFPIIPPSEITWTN